MNEWFKKLVGRVRHQWGKWSLLQKGILLGVLILSIAGLILLVTFNAAPTSVPVLTRPVSDQSLLNRISARLDQEGLGFTVTEDGRVMVSDRATAQEARAVLVREDLIPTNTDPWEIFDIERWTITDFERNVNLRRAITDQLTQHIKSLADVDGANVNLVIPEDSLFAEDQDPVTASVIIVPKPGSDIRENRKKIEGIEKLIQFAVPGLLKENITITDQSGQTLNDFVALQDFDRLEVNRRELEIKRNIEKQYIQAIKSALGSIFTIDRVEVPNIDIEIDYGNRTVEQEEFFPIVVTEDNPRTPFDETETVLSIERGREDFKEDYQGSGFNPQGPPGQEGQTPPAYKDLEGLVGTYSRSSTTINNEVNRKVTSETGSPSIKRISVAVALDGVWVKQYDENGNLLLNPDGSIVREYVPINEAQLESAQQLIESAVGYSQNRGDQVRVRNIQFDRTAEHRLEDAEIARERQVQTVLLWVMVGLASILVIFIVFRVITREIERRRRLREEELARQHQAMREAALRSAEEESAEVEMSVEERARLEIQENAINIAREHPEDVAQLIRTWLLEE